MAKRTDNDSIHYKLTMMMRHFSIAYYNIIFRISSDFYYFHDNLKIKVKYTINTINTTLKPKQIFFIRRLPIMMGFIHKIRQTCQLFIKTKSIRTSIVLMRDLLLSNTICSL